MPPIAAALAYIALSAIFGFVLRALFGASAGWAAFSLGLLAQLGFHLRHLLLLDAWSRQPSPALELEGSGMWYAPFSRLLRHERGLGREIDALRAELASFRAAGQALGDGIVALRGGQIEWCNRLAEDFLGLDLDTDVGQPITHLLRQPAFVAYLNGGDFSEPLRIKAARGNAPRSLSIRIVSYSLDRQLVQIWDVTQAERVDRMRRDFVANVSHELRTPLTVLKGFLETLREIDLAREGQANYLALMAEQSDRMLHIIQDLLTLSTLESAPPIADDRHIDAAALIAKIMRDAEALSGGRHNIRLETNGQGNLRGSESEIGSAFGNLVSNALRYTPDGGAITLYWHIGPEGAEFAVEDTGIGIEPQHLPRLTERFYRIDRGRSRDTGGTGLGLAIVKHALNRHQASLDIQSTPGRGSRFAVRFPAGRVVAAT